ncbi:MAG: serine hydrolase domain-containing protein [Candidatus Dormiibacterota bacterium]
MKVAAVQTEQRLPSLVVAVASRGQAIDHVSIGKADFRARREAGPDVQYRIGSITKTFTAMAVMQLVGEGRLDLRRPLSQGWAGAPHDELSLADFLSHGSGLQREPPGRVWETLQFPAREELAANAGGADRLYPPDSWFHYSNLGFALLGELVVQVSGASWETYLQERILGPLEMRRTAPVPDPNAAQGYAVRPYSDDLVEEPALDTRGIAPAGQLWSTADDLCRWTGALAGCHPDVIAPNLLEQMRAPRTIADLEHWSSGFGLGLMLIRDGENIYVGHTGSMPGFVAAAFCHPGSGLGIVMLSNSTAGFNIGVTAAELLTLVREGHPATSEWGPGQGVPDRIQPILGRWWSEWSEWIFIWKDGKLQATQAGTPAGEMVTEFAEIGTDEFVAVTGTERGELLTLERGEGDDSVEVRKLYWATYPFTREPQAFGGPSRSSEL